MDRPVATKTTSETRNTQASTSTQNLPHKASSSSSNRELLALQDIAGNQTVGRLLELETIPRASGPTALPSMAQVVMQRSDGHALDTTTRATMEARFHTDLSQVRVHTNSAAATSARALNARAYTYGHHVVFGKGRYTPHTQHGRQLLTHELTHVIQQASGSVKSADRLEHEAELAGRGIIPTPSWGPSPRPKLQLSPEQAIKLTIVLRRDNRADFMLETDDGNQLSSSGTAGNLSEGMYRTFYSADESMMIIQQEDGTPLAPGLRFRTSGDAQRLDQLLIATTTPIPLEVRAGIPGIDAIPESIRNTIFSGSGRTARRYRPRDRAAILRIADKLSQLSDSELEAYRARTVGTTQGLATFEASVDRYIEEVLRHREAVQERERTKLQLFGLDDVYRQYKLYKSLLSSSTSLSGMGAVAPGAVGTSLGMQPTINETREELTANLQPYGFDSIAEFEQSIRDFEIAFRDETVFIARDLLDRYEHVLYEQEQRYQNAAETATLHRQLRPAREHFREANRIRDEHAMMPLTPGEMGEQEHWNRLFRQEQRQGRSVISGLSDAHPLLGNPDLPHEELALASRSDVRRIILGYIRERRSDVQQTRRNLADNPDLVFELDTLLQMAYREQNIQPNSIYHMIIQDHMRDTQIERALINLAIAVFAIAAGLLSAGTGTVAVLGAAAAFGAGAYQAIEEFRRYERLTAAHGAQLLSDDPSFAWVIVALVGAGIDLAAVGVALRTLRPAVQAFNETSDLVALERRLAELGQVDARIRQNVLRAAELEARTRAAWRSVFRPPAVLRAVIVPGAEEFGRLVYAVYLSVRRGLASFEQFVLTREAVELIGDVGRLAPDELTNLKAAYSQAIRESEDIARHGGSLAMADNEIHAFMRLRNNQPGMTVEQVMQEMDAWRATRQSGVPFGFSGADQFAEFRATAQAELRRLLRRSDRNAEAFLQGSSITGVSYSRQVPFDATSDLDVAISSRILFRRARTELGLEAATGPRRIGPLADEHIRALGLGRLRDRLGRVLVSEGGEAAAEAGTSGSRQINFMLFENERAVRQPIRGSTETTRATIPLRGDE